MIWTLLASTGMLAVGALVWKALSKQGYASPPTDDEPPAS
tara:strand:+ start:11051 stop:11170 length:120 start_codon:yes stop_codon:yes gene_type:complete